MTAPLQPRQFKLNEQQFFHGTAAELKPGDMLQPGHAGGESRTGMDQVFITTNPEQAKHYARVAAHGTGRDTSLVPHVYTVEPTGSSSPDWTTGKGKPQDITASKTYDPVRVTGEHWRGKSLDETYAHPKPSVFDRWTK